MPAKSGDPDLTPAHTAIPGITSPAVKSQASARWQHRHHPGNTAVPQSAPQNPRLEFSNLNIANATSWSQQLEVENQLAMSLQPCNRVEKTL